MTNEQRLAEIARIAYKEELFDIQGNINEISDYGEGEIYSAKDYAKDAYYKVVNNNFDHPDNRHCVLTDSVRFLTKEAIMNVCLEQAEKALKDSDFDIIKNSKQYKAFVEKQGQKVKKITYKRGGF